MPLYLRAVHKLLQAEVGGTAEPRLLPLLKDNDWWLRSVHARKICAWVSIECTEPSYFRDVYVWLPEVRWGMAAMPCCRSCKSNSRVGAHCWRDNHFGRRIIAMDTCYFAISRRYICYGCQELALAAKEAAKAAADASGLQLVVEGAAAAEEGGGGDAESSVAAYTQMGWGAPSFSVFLRRRVSSGPHTSEWGRQVVSRLDEAPLQQEGQAGFFLHHAARDVYQEAREGLAQA